MQLLNSKTAFTISGLRSKSSEQSPKSKNLNRNQNRLPLWKRYSRIQKPDTYTHSLPIETASNQRLRQSINNKNQNKALKWLKNGIQPSASTVSPIQKNTVRLHEQGASKKRTGQYWIGWFCWVLLVTVPAHAVECINGGASQPRQRVPIVPFAGVVNPVLATFTV